MSEIMRRLLMLKAHRFWNPDISGTSLFFSQQDNVKSSPHMLHCSKHMNREENWEQLGKSFVVGKTAVPLFLGMYYRNQIETPHLFTRYCVKFFSWKLKYLAFMWYSAGGWKGLALRGLSHVLDLLRSISKSNFISVWNVEHRAWQHDTECVCARACECVWERQSWTQSSEVTLRSLGTWQFTDCIFQPQS